MLQKLSQPAAAQAAYQRAIGLSEDAAIREFLLMRALAVQGNQASE